MLKHSNLKWIDSLYKKVIAKDEVVYRSNNLHVISSSENLYNFQVKKKLLILKLSVSYPKNSGYTNSLINGNRIREENIR